MDILLYNIYRRVMQVILQHLQSHLYIERHMYVDVNQMCIHASQAFFKLQIKLTQVRWIRLDNIDNIVIQSSITVFQRDDLSPKKTLYIYLENLFDFCRFRFIVNFCFHRLQFSSVGKLFDACCFLFLLSFISSIFQLSLLSLLLKRQLQQLVFTIFQDNKQQQLLLKFLNSFLGIFLVFALVTQFRLLLQIHILLFYRLIDNNKQLRNFTKNEQFFFLSKFQVLAVFRMRFSRVII
eukprot:TRINITY_DN4042_c0_g1_i20.p2 TRINITY_DN4042_c0_g1~~TRINITY_DN4042_c0_g1_i20.p2  ORF type:complete len:237 (-),score=-10.65 TRINITY_DN4042_c0_g1_i20:616-1326(-)